MQCKICNRIFKSPLSLSIHLFEKHKIKSVDYYNIYLKTDVDGLCKSCGNLTKFISITFGYQKYCSSKCSNSSEDTKEKKKFKYNQNFGVDNPSKSILIKEKKKHTSIKNFGVENPTQSKEIKEKKKINCIKKYGVENPTQSKEIKEKIKQTCLFKYGVPYTHQNNKILKKVQSTMLLKYGYKNIFESPLFKDRIKKIMLNKYGFDNYSKTEEFRLLARCLIQKKLLLSHGKWVVPIGKNEKQILSDLQKMIREKIFETYPVIGYFIDGYIAELNLAIEIDEIHHKQNKCHEKDIKRQNNIQNFLKCIFFRIDEKEWIDNKQSIIENFIFTVHQLELENELREIKRNSNQF